MIQVFAKSRMIQKCGIFAAVALSALYAFFLCSRSGIGPQLVSVAVLFALVLFFSWFAAMFAAESENQRYLSILYNDMDPRAFIGKYSPLLEQKGLTDLQILALDSHLSNAYAYAGDFGEAVRILEGCRIPESGRSIFNARSLVAGNLCSCYLLAGDAGKAEEKLEELGSIIETAAEINAPLSKSYARNRKVQAIHLALLQGKAVDAEALRRELKGSSNRLNRMRIRLLLATAFLDDGQKEAAEEQLDYIGQAGGDTVIARQAQALRAKMIR